MWPFKIPPEVKAAKKAVVDAATKSRKTQWGDIEDIAAELSSKYDAVIDARGKFQEARQALEELEVKAKVAQALGQQAPDLNQAKETVKKAQAILQAYESQLRLTERRAKKKYPDVFHFL